MNESPDIKTTKGILLFHSETGTEGGWYAWQDGDYIHGGEKGDPCPWGEKSCPVFRGDWHQHAQYEGLHYLHNGDHLRVFTIRDDGEVLWEGDVKLTLRDDVYKNPEAVVSNMWVNQEPDMGIDRMVWANMFFDELPCEVTHV